MVTDMSNRDLFRAAVLAWATAAVVAVVFGLPVLVMVGGVHIDVGLTVNALAVIGSVGAASVALWIATRDRQDRERDARITGTSVSRKPTRPTKSKLG
jgi:hypothetical protein